MEQRLAQFSNDYKFGFLGEAYIEDEKLEFNLHQAPEILKKYFSLKKPYYCNRNSSYYSTELVTVFEYIEICPKDLNKILTFNINQKTKQYILFSIMNHQISNISKLVGVVFSNERLRTNYIESVKEYLQHCTDYFICIIYGNNPDKFISFDSEILSEIKDIATSLENIQVREYSEMDHPLILFSSFWAYKQFISEKDLILAPLQGGSIIPPMYISLLKYAQKSDEFQQGIRFDYLKFSTYDTGELIDISLRKQVELLGEKYSCDENILLIDDNTGTATTIKKLRTELECIFNNITTGVLECRWDTKIIESDYPAFNMNDIDIITPLCYRHFRRFENEIEYMKNVSIINAEFSFGEFYNLEFIFDQFDFESFLESSEITESNKSRLMTVISKYRSQIKAEKTLRNIA
ncbi:hypothetical protein [Fusibacter sp. JL216-2]|uniref:hypothetical protein n=1 Tax=Fusibacter sp. JL216-2 TaxID=3071453 RepID=UPI003D32718F